MIGALPTDDGGALVCFLTHDLSKVLPQRWAVTPTPKIIVRAALIVAGSFAFKKNIEVAVPGLKDFLSILRNKLRIFIDTSPKSILTGQGVKHLWHTVQ